MILLYNEKDVQEQDEDWISAMSESGQSYEERRAILPIPEAPLQDEEDLSNRTRNRRQGDIAEALTQIKSSGEIFALS